MKIHNESGLATIDYRKVQPFQGDLKDLSDENHGKLLRVLEKRGFTSPLLLWKDGDTHRLLDGHQRHRVMSFNDLNDDGNYEVPYVLIPAASAKEAKEQLLEIDSRYGRTTVEGFDEFAWDLDVPDLDISMSDIDLEKLTADLDPLEEAEPEKPKGAKKWTTDELRELAKSYYPADLQTITGFLAVVDERS